MMMVATPRATMANQLKKGTVQLNVLQKKRGKQKREETRQSYIQPTTQWDRVDWVGKGILILSNPNKLIWMPPYYKFIMLGLWK